MKKFLFIFKHFCHSRENGNLVTRLKLVHWIPAYAGMTIIIGLFFAFPAYGATSVFYSVGQSSSDMKVASTITITSGAAVFSAAQTGNIGVGDRVTYDSDNKIAYISAKTNADQMHWTLITATGGTPTDVTGVTVNSITREYTSLSAAEAGATDANHLNTSDLTSGGGYQLNFPCYYDTGADTTSVAIDGYTTGSANYIKVYTPNNTTTESNFSQRHEGKWDETKFRLSINGDVLGIKTGYVRIDGLQAEVSPSNTGDYRDGIFIPWADNQASAIYISNNIIKQTNSGGSCTGISTNSSVGPVVYIWNNIVYGFLNSRAFSLEDSSFVYNNLAYNSNIGFDGGASKRAKNNIVRNCADGFSSNFDSSSTNNLTDLSPSDAAFGTSADSGTTDLIGTDTKKLRDSGQDFTTTVKVGMIVKNTTDTTYSYVTRVNSDTEIELNDDILDDSENFTIYTNRFGKARFLDEANSDFHLHPLDTAALNNGADLTSDANLPITTDIDGHARPTQSYFDIGADEATTKIYRSVAPDADGNMAALTTGTSNGMTLEGGSPYGNLSGLIVATFDVPLADNIGVGDAMQYDADNDSDIDASDKIVFIHERLDSTHYIVKKSDGTNPTAMTYPDTNWSIFRAYTSLSNAEAGTENTGIDSDLVNFDTGNVNLTTNNLQWNIACYANGTTADTTAVTISGWTTASANYLKIYTPINVNEVGVSQRHGGKWNQNYYRLEISSGNSFYLSDSYINIDGLQITTANASSLINTFPGKIGIYKINNNLLKSTSALGYSGVVYLQGFSSGSKVYVWNNIFYDNTSAGARSIQTNDSDVTLYAYNNTMASCATGIYNSLAFAIYTKNNLIQCSYAFGGTFADDDAFNDYNSISENNSGEVAIGSHGKYNQTFTFIDAANKDFHLASTDAGAKNYGADLRTDPYLPINRDIDYASESDSGAPESDSDAFGNRPSGSAFDIGADERLTNVYYSVGQDTTTDLKVASTIGITNGIMTFSAPQTGNIGVGDVIDYDSDNKKAYISGKVDQSNWQVVTNLGDKPTDISSGVTVNSIKRVWGSLSLAEAGSSGASYIGTSDLSSAGVVLNLPCYYDTGADTTAVTIDGWTTSVTNYIRIYTPFNTNTEANNSQRHSGKWDEGKWRFEATNAWMFETYEDYVVFEGLQMKTKVTTASYRCILHRASAGETKVLNNIFVGEISGAGLWGRGYDNEGGTTNDKIYNNIFYGFNNNSTSLAIQVETNSYIYNNTIYDCYIGIERSVGGTTIIKNNISQNCTDGFSGTFASGSDFNISNIASDAPGANSQNGVTVSFEDSANYDFHLAWNDTVARSMGTDLRFDPNLPVSTDIDNHWRSNLHYGGSTSSGGSGIDIGADQSTNKIFRSVGPSATSSITTGGSNAMTISGNIATFATALADNIGVGDAIQYDSDNNSSIDSIAFISKRTDSTHYVLQSPHGTYPNQTSASDLDWSLFRAYSSLSNAESATENTGINASFRNFDDWSGGKNIASTNEQWNMACYANGTTADTMVNSYVDINGWSTYDTNYIKVYAPTQIGEVGVSQRHQGKWDTSKYYLLSSGTSATGIRAVAKNVWIDGLQIQNNNSTSSPEISAVTVSTAGVRLTLSGSILRGPDVNTNDNTRTGLMTFAIGNIKYWVYNNISYNWGKISNKQVGLGLSGTTGFSAYVFNNTVYDNYIGVASNYGALLKNNLSYNNTTDYSGTFSSSSTHNLSKDATAPAFGTYYRNATVQFSDSANKDFHLASSDTAARNAGADLSADSYLAFSTDIDGHARSTSSHTGAWDIGADEGATAIYYSVGQNTTSHETGSGTVTVDATARTATFSVAQTATNMGVGDVIDYDSDNKKCYITGKSTTSVWYCQSVIGTAPTAATGATVNSISHKFSALNSAVNTGVASDASEVLGTADLWSNNYQLNIPCYYDSGADTTATTVDGWTTSVTNYVRIYTPFNTNTETNQSQRHQGKLDTGKYYFSSRVIIENPNVVLDGLQMRPSSLITELIYISASGKTKISNLILDGFGNISYGIRVAGSGNAVDIWNSVIYGIPVIDDSSRRGISAQGITNVYNTTVIGGYWGVVRSSGTLNLKNVYAGGSFSADIYDASSKTTCATEDATGSTGLQNIAINTTNFNNVTSGSEDYHLASGSVLKNVGTDSSADSSLAFSTDIDGNTRNIDSRGWDIGADEAATQIYFSASPETVQTDLKTTADTLLVDITNGVATFDESQTGNLGVGDVIDYDSDNKKAYIVSKVDTSNWYVQTVTGALPTTVTGVTVNSIKHTYTSLSNAEAGAATLLGTSDLVTANYQLNIPCYYQSAADTTTVTIDGWTTAPTNYIKVYTPNSTTTEANFSQRHQGKWDDSKYYLSVYGQRIFDNYQTYIKIEGLQMKNKEDRQNGDGFYDYTTGKSGDIWIIGNIIKQESVAPKIGSRGINLETTKSDVRYFVNNNIIYNFSYSGGNGIRLFSNSKLYAYNNTIYSCETGFKNDAGTFLVKNNLSYNNTDNYSGTFDASSTNNLSGPTQTDAPGSNPQNAKTVHFVDENSYDFHLAANDTAAREAGADLSTDAINRVSTDIDGHTRPTLGAFDIGADEGVTAIYYSVGQNTNDHKTTTGTLTVTIASGTATFSEAQTATNMGVGDKVTYNTNVVAYIKEKISTTQWKLITATGAVPADITDSVVVSIAHPFASLSSAESGAEGASYLNTNNLYSGNYQLNFPCYYDSGADTTAVTISGWTTYPTNYIKIYTPNNTNTEVNQSQRHQGKWDEGKYRLEGTAAGISFESMVYYVRIDGIQLKHRNAGGDNFYGIAIRPGLTDCDIRISNNIIKRNSENLNNSSLGIYLNASPMPGSKVFIYNNIVYDYGTGNSGSTGIAIQDNYGSGRIYVYNNTSYNNYKGFLSIVANSGIAKNNLSYNNTTDYSGTFSSSSTHNLSKDATAPAYGTYYRNATVQFASVNDYDFHLSLSDTAARNNGKKLASYADDSNLNFTSDIDGQERTGEWSIGADDGPIAQIATSQEVNQNATAGLDYGLVLYQPFNGEDISGTTSYDRSGHNNHGTISGATSTMGKRGQGMNFDGTDDYVTISNESNFDFDRTSSFSISAWVNYNYENTNFGVVSKMFNGGNFQGLDFKVDAINNRLTGGLVGATGGCGTDCIYNTTAFNTLKRTTWQYVTMTYDGSSTAAGLRLYINGTDLTQVGGNTVSSSLLNNTSLIIGDNPTAGGTEFNGKLDELRVYNRALSADEVGQLYRLGEEKINASQKDNAKNGLVGLWTFDGPDVNTATHIAYDRSGQGNNGTISGAVPAMGKRGQGMSFDGNDRMTTSLKMTGENFMTFSAWVKEGTGNIVNTNFSTNRYGWSVPGFLIYCYNGTQWRAKIHDASDVIIGTLGSSWNQIGFTYDGTYLKTYKNGAVVNSSNIGSKTIAGDLGTYLGSSDNGFRGVIDDVRIYNRALSAAEMMDLYRMGEVRVKE